MPTLQPGAGTAEIRPTLAAHKGVSGRAGQVGGTTPPASATSRISDNFEDGVIATPLWGGNYGAGMSETGGRARIPADTGYNAFNTQPIYTFDSVLLQAFPHAAAGATASGLDISIRSNAQPAGTDVAVYIDVVNNIWYPSNRTDYWDNTASSIPYNATAHAWFRMRISGADLLWETSPDGTTWTLQRSIPAPAYLLTATDIAFSVQAHRDAGTNNYAEFDNFNVVPGGKSSVTSTVDLRWGVASSVTGSIDLQWAVKASVVAGTDLRWAVLSAVSQSLSVNWGVASAVTSTLDARWGVLATVSAALDAWWDVLNAVTASTDLRWTQRAQATNSNDLRWQVKQSVTSTLDVRWQVRQAVSATLDLGWAVKGTASSALDLRWQVRSAVSNVVEAQWSVLSAVNSTADLRWSVCSAVSSTLDLQWISRAGVTGVLDLRYAIESDSVTETLFATEIPTGTYEETNVSLGTRFHPVVTGVSCTGARWYCPSGGPGGSGTVTAYLWRVSDQAQLASVTFSAPTQSAWNTAAWSGGAVALTQGVVYQISYSTSLRYMATPSYVWPKNSTGSSLVSESPAGYFRSGLGLFPNSAGGASYFADGLFEVEGGGTSEVTSTVDLRWQVRQSVTSMTDLRWAVKAAVSNTSDLRWQVREAVTAALDARWAVKTTATATLDARWAVRESVYASLDLRWTQRAQATNTLTLQWSSAGTVSSSIALQWAVKNAVTGTLDARWGVTGQMTAVLALLWISRQRATGTVQLTWVVEGDVFKPRPDVKAYMETRLRVRPQQASTVRAVM